MGGFLVDALFPLDEIAQQSCDSLNSLNLRQQYNNMECIMHTT